jgi:spermidine/putrescine transport system permease protein
VSYDRRPWLLYAVVLAIYAFLFVPIFVVVGNSFNADSSMVSWGGFTTHWYHEACCFSLVR